ncbi:MAG: PilZ domain-containing protein [Vicinamibacterales bacterium]
MSAHNSSAAVKLSGAERRSSRRKMAVDLPTLSARLVAGPDVRLLDISRGGARFESDNRLLPGTSVGLRLVQNETIFLAMARVVRSRVARLESGTLRYESAVAFEKDCPLISEDEMPSLGAGLATPVEPVEPVQADAPSEVAPAHEPKGRASKDAAKVLTFTALVPSAMPDVRRLLVTNRW